MSMFEKQTPNCPTCGGPLAIEHRFVRMVVCQYCGTNCEITREGLAPAGQFARLVPLPTRFAVGLAGKVRGRGFRVLGRVRYQYDEGVWDEWYLAFDDGQGGWLAEDEGEYVLSQAEELRTEVPPFEQVQVGAQLQVNGYPFFVTERVRARIAGAEGQLFYPAAPGKPVRFVDGNVRGRTAYLEYSDEGVEFGIGESVPRSEIWLEGGR